MVVSLYRQGKVWWLRYGKKFGLPRRSTGTKDKKLAEEIRRSEEYRLLFGHYEKPVRSILLSDFILLFLEYKKGQGKARATVEAYRYALNNFGKSIKQDLSLDTITIDMIEAFAAERRSKGRAEKTIRNELITLLTAFRWAKRQRYIRRESLRTTRTTKEAEVSTPIPDP